MNSVLKKIARLVDSEEDAVKCAAIRVLGELGVKERSILKLLGQKLQKESDPVKTVILDTFIQNPQAGALNYLLPLLKTDGLIRRKVIHAIAALGPKAIATLGKEYQTAPVQEKKLFIDIFSAIHSRPSIAFLIDTLAKSDLEILKYICFALRNQVEKLSRAEKAFLLKRVSKYLGQNSVRSNDEATTSGVLLLGYLGEISAKRILVKYLDRKFSFYVRRNALISLTRIGLKGSGHDDLIDKLFPLLNDPDFPNVVRNALTILEAVQLPRRFFRYLPKLLESRHPAVKRFALTQLANIPGEKTVRLLISHLGSPDPMIRDAAAESLAKLPRAIPKLLQKMMGTKDIEKGEKLALILRNQREYFKKNRCASLYRKLGRAVEKQDPQSKIYALLLKQVNPDFYYAETMKRGRQLKRARKFELAKRYFELVSSGLFYTDEVRYEQACLFLKLSKKDLSLASRNADPALNLFAALARSSYHDLVKRVKQDRVLDANDLYYLGHHFAERIYEQKSLGIEVLKHLVKKYQRAKVKALAKKKLAQATSSAELRERPVAAPAPSPASA